MSDPIVYKEGMLFKRQRGLHTSNTKKLKFQERFCCLTNTSLDYYDPKKKAEGPRGQFAVEKMKIVEAMKNYIFGRECPYALQIGDHQEIMYFITDSEASRDEWLEAFRLASRDANVVMLPQHHHGVYGLLNKGRWSCCANQRRDTVGCSTSTGSVPSTNSRKDHTLTLPHPSLTTLNESKTSSLPRSISESPHSTPPPITPLYPGESQAPRIRKFTTTNPLIKPDAKKLRLLRQSVDFDSVKLTELDEEDSPKIIPEKESPSMNGKDMLMIKEVDSGERSSSPSPSDDSGRGTSVGNSRPNSQIEDNRIIRSESVGKKPSQSVIMEQVKAEVYTGAVIKHDPVEGSADSSKTVTPEETPVRKQGSSHEEVNKEEEKSSRVAGKGVDEIDGKHRLVNRVASSPPPYDPSPHLTDKPRPISVGSFEVGGDSLTGSGSEVSVGGSPHIKKVKRVGGRPESLLGRPSFFMPEQPRYNQLHQACKDGNLESLAKVLGYHYQCSELVDLELLSNEETRYTPLFIAFLNDHYQTMVQLLEHGANPNTTEPLRKSSVLHWACEKGCEDIVDLLVRYKADVNKRDGAGSTPLVLACKNGHLEIVEFLLKNGACVNDESIVGRTPLHECAEEGQTEIMDMLLTVGRADPACRDQNDFSPYDIAINKRNSEMMRMLQQVTPEIIRPYTLLHTRPSKRGQMITSLAFKSSSMLISGSLDTHTRFLSTSDLSELDSVRMADTVLDLSVYNHTHIAIGSTSIQVVDIENLDRKRTIADDTNEDESLEDPPLHLVKFGPKGRLVTASAESNLVKLWPPVVSQSGGLVTMPEAMFVVGEESEKYGCIYCLSTSPTPNCPWLAVGFQPGSMFSPKGNKLVYIYDWETKTLKQIFDGGEGGLKVGVHVEFSPCGRFVAIGCGKNLCIWDPKGGDLVQKFTIERDSQISSVAYSCNGSHLAAGLKNGEVQVFEMSSSNPIFYLLRQKESPVTALAYSENGKMLATGQQNGCVQLWEVYGCVASNSTDS